MNNPVDNKLKSRIREVFEDYEDPTADAGWQKLREKYPEHNRRPLILWLSSAAALLLLATSLWLVSRTEDNVALKPSKEDKTFTSVEKPESIPGNEEIAMEENVSKPSRSETDYTARKPGKAKTEQVAVIQEEGHDIPAGQRPAQVDFTDQMPTIETTQILSDVPRAEVIPATKTASLLIKTPDDFSIGVINPKQPAYQDISDLRETETENNGKEPAIKNQKLVFSVFAGSYYNYSEGSENQLNFGAGFLSDIRLSPHLKLSTGLGIASNSLDFDLNEGPNLPQNASASFDSALKLSSGNLTTITGYEAKLLTLDIPLNIKYQFVPESDRFYIATGLSSGTYLSETYAYKYRIFNTASGSYTSRSQDQKNRKQLNDFDLGRTLNFSFGVSTRFGKGQSISIEPFLKYPLGGLGSENLKFGSQGINLKLRFNPVKK